jgi:hypothetical protein
LRDILRRQGRKDAYALDMDGKVGRDLCDLRGRYMTLAGREDEADGIGTELCG